MMSQGIEPAGPPMAIYYDETFVPTNLDVAVAFPVAQSVTASLTSATGLRLVVRELEGIPQAACIIHAGSYDSFSETYSALGKWIEANGYQIAGPVREIYLSPPDAETGPITEIQMPVSRYSRRRLLTGVEPALSVSA